MARPYRFKARDVLVLLIALAFMTILVNKVMILSKLEMPQQGFTLKIAAEQKPAYLADSIQPGDYVYQRGASEPFGKIVAVETAESMMLVADDYGQMHYKPVDGLYDIFMTVDTSGFVSLNGSPIIDRTFFYVNMYLPLFTERADFATRVIEIE
jgi:hypothetical protein